MHLFLPLLKVMGLVLPAVQLTKGKTTKPLMCQQIYLDFI